MSHFKRSPYVSQIAFKFDSIYLSPGQIRAPPTERGRGRRRPPRYGRGRAAAVFASNFPQAVVLNVYRRSPSPANCRSRAARPHALASITLGLLS
ncbi:hypothetical protein EVAR_43203_1 [Eumeta japonica]|uniref:Uncharacterized protein n=1 Tax=Eumeta variegata TaxID=151549 RepID=A0A4C1WS16_EUMVA|nr:hypothetical protein EVAR_43203_1 [Eumeta japonica]